MLGRALRRHLRELPAFETGLSLTERLTLEIVRDEGPVPVGATFAELMKNREPLPYLGDLMFRALIQPLMRADGPLLEVVRSHGAEWPHRELALTPLGAGVLAGEQHWLDLLPVRWVGGVRIPSSGGGSWCFNEPTDAVVWRGCAA